MSAIATDARASSSVVAVAWVIAALCWVVVVASSSEDADSSAAAELTSTPAVLVCSTRSWQVPSMVLKPSPSSTSSLEPDGSTRAARSPFVTRRATSVSRRIGRVVHQASAIEAAMTRAPPISRKSRASRR